MTTVFQRIGPYEIVKEIGRGGMAAVFLAEDSRHSRQVALKLVPISHDREGQEILDAERWGARLQERLAEACGMVPRVYEEGDQPPYYFIAMEYVQGENLSDVISRGPAAPLEATRIVSALCRFLDTAHRFKTAIDGREFWSLVHGDLKPRNVRLSDSGDIKVLDFGIAKALSLSRKVTRNDFGSMPYLSPERLESTEVDAGADLWALGVILYELLSGTPPFHAVDTRRLEQQIRAGYPRRPLPSTCPIAIQAIVSRLLAPQPDERYESAAAVLAAGFSRMSRRSSNPPHAAAGRHRIRGYPSHRGFRRAGRLRPGSARAQRAAAGSNGACDCSPGRTSSREALAVPSGPRDPDARGIAPRLQRARRRIPGEPGRGERDDA